MKLTGSVVVSVVRTNADGDKATEIEDVAASEFGLEEGRGRSNIYIASLDGYELKLTAECRGGKFADHDLKLELTEDRVTAFVKDDLLEVHC